MNSDHVSESGMVLFELLIAMTLIVGSITAAHTVYLQLASKKIQLEKSHEAWVQSRNQYEIKLYLDRLLAQQSRAHGLRYSSHHSVSTQLKQ